VTTASDPDDLAARQEQAQIRILHVLREFNLVDVPSICPVVAALAASMMFRVSPEDRPQIREEFDRLVAHFLREPIAGVSP
jgi:hypothetical protein